MVPNINVIYCNHVNNAMQKMRTINQWVFECFTFGCDDKVLKLTSKTYSQNILAATILQEIHQVAKSRGNCFFEDIEFIAVFTPQHISWCRYKQIFYEDRNMLLFDLSLNNKEFALVVFENNKDKMNKQATSQISNHNNEYGLKIPNLNMPNTPKYWKGRRVSSIQSIGAKREKRDIVRLGIL